MSIKGSLSGKTALVTGATSGIGLTSLIMLAAEGASVIGVGRNAARVRDAETQVRAKVPEAQVRYLLADLSDQAQVRRLAADTLLLLRERGAPSLDILVNNAGVYAQYLTRTTDDIELTLAVNHLAPFLLTHELLPVLTNGPDQRVITVSSFAHRLARRMNVMQLNRPPVYLGLLAYARSKLANILFTREFNRRMQAASVRAFALDPGLVRTEIAMKERGWLSHLVWANRMKYGYDPEVPAKTLLYLCSESSVLHERNIYWHNLKPRVPNPNALDDQLAVQLWHYSCALCKITDW
jgi:NAD(P)-dependent dehydrogenase (short-subunit alcohol dehydrogenase family)